MYLNVCFLNDLPIDSIIQINCVYIVHLCALSSAPKPTPRPRPSDLVVTPAMPLDPKEFTGDQQEPALLAPAAQNSLSSTDVAQDIPSLTSIPSVTPIPAAAPAVAPVAAASSSPSPISSAPMSKPDLSAVNGGVNGNASTAQTSSSTGMRMKLFNQREI